MSKSGALLKKLHPRNWLEFASPVTLGFAGMSLLALVLSALTGGGANRLLFSVYRFSPGDALSYVRLFLHVLGHADFAHLAGNMTLFLVLSPLVEKHFGARQYLLMLALTALITGLFHILLSVGTQSMGASGVVFMLILLSAASGSKEGKIPITLVLVGILYLGREVSDLITQKDNISQLAHIIGGLCGMGFGLWWKPRKKITV